MEIRNPFGYAITVTAVSITESGFEVRGDGCSGTELAPSAGCSFGVVFRPQQPGPVKGIINVRLTHRCTSNTYFPCSWVPPEGGVSVSKNFERTELSNGQVVIEWPTFLHVTLVGEGTTDLETSTMTTTPAPTEPPPTANTPDVTGPPPATSPPDVTETAPPTAPSTATEPTE
jgi:hypothetical protein